VPGCRGADILGPSAGTQMQSQGARAEANVAALEPFFKYHGLGNDFLVLDRRLNARDIEADVARALCDRRRGVGADGVLVLLPPVGAAIARMVVHNADGSIAEMCGNGLRCVVRYLAEKAGGHPPAISVETGAGLLTSQIDWGVSGVNEVTVSMGPARVLFANETVSGHRGTAISMGNPHFVLLNADPGTAAVIGPKLEVHARFPDRTNVELCRLEKNGDLDVVVWERGVGITQACGTGACAAVAASALAGSSPFDAWVRVKLPGGALQVKVQKDLEQVQLKGPATFVYEGTLP
jgi:diaminopimelate epimerase